MDTKIKVIKGTTLKVKIIWSYPSSPQTTLDNTDFVVEFKSMHSQIFQKSELYHDTNPQTEGWYAYVDTNIIGNGNLTMRLTANILDIHAPNNTKVDISECNTGVVIYG